MARLIDEILADRRVLVSGEWAKLGEDWPLESAHPIVADEISREYYGPRVDPHHVLNFQNDLGPLHLPYPITWIEYRVGRSMTFGWVAQEFEKEEGGWKQFWRGFVKGDNGRIGLLTSDIFQVFLTPTGRVAGVRPLSNEGGEYQPKWNKPEQADRKELGVLNVSFIALDILNTTSSTAISAAIRESS